MPKNNATKTGSHFDLTTARVPPRRLFEDDAPRVAQEMLGMVLVRREAGRLLAGRIVELEAYLGQNDAAAHAAAGRTPRNQVLFGPPGHAYVYLIYGAHWCLNISCMPDGLAGGVLFRALEPLAGLEQMAEGRGLGAPEQSTAQLRLLTSGPGRLAQAFGVTRPRDNGKDLLDAGSDLLLLDDGYRPARVLRTGRIGITKAADQLLRYVIAGNPFVSGPRH
jgi:DNA-3-methyladenine glycosylase